MFLQYKTTEFATIGGSRSLGIEIPTSDIDLIIVASNPNYQLRMKGGYNTLYKSRVDFYEMLTLPSRNYVHIFQFLYPDKFMTDNEFTDWIIANRDALMDENKATFYADTCNFLENVRLNLEAYHKIATKRISHALAYGKIVERYSSGESMTDCFKAEADWRDILLKIRKKEMQYENVKELVDIALSNVIEIQRKTETSNVKKKTNELKEILDSTYFKDYADNL